MPSESILVASEDGQLLQVLDARDDADAEDRAWALATARLLRDREALTAALKDEALEPAIPPGMPIG